MFRSSLRLYPLVLLAFFAGPAVGMAPAVTLDYARDDTLAGTAIDVDAIRARPVTLSEVLALVEAQTELRFTYGNRGLPLHRKFVLDTGRTITLSRLFLRLSSVLNIAFLHRGRQIVVRPLEADDEIVRLPPRRGPPATAPA